MLDIIKNISSTINYAGIITTVIIAALGTFIAQIRPYVKELLDDATQYVKLQIQSGQYEEMLNKAYDIWKLVDENFRIGAAITAAFKDKAEYFDSLLLEQFPSLTQNEIDYIRQVVAGNENSDKLADSSSASSEAEAEDQNETADTSASADSNADSDTSINEDTNTDSNTDIATSTDTDTAVVVTAPISDSTESNSDSVNSDLPTATQESEAEN
jgi:hypothetical protein